MMHKITINGRDNAAELSKYYGLKKTMYEPGEMVKFSFPTATDTSYKVTSAQVSIPCAEHKPGGISAYSFVMPDTDVEIDISSHSSMVNPYMTGAPLPSMGMTGMNSPMGADSESDPDPFPWDGKPKFCAECGAPTKLSNKFCRECGAPLLAKK